MDRFIHFRRNEFLPFFVQTGLSLLLYIIDTKSNRHYRINYPSPGSISVFCFQTLLIVLVIWFILEYRVVEGRKKTKDITYTIVWYTPCRALPYLFLLHTHKHTHTHTTKFQTMFIYLPYGFRLLPILILIAAVIIRINKIEIEIIRWCWWCCSWEHDTYFLSLSPLSSSLFLVLEITNDGRGTTGDGNQSKNGKHCLRGLHQQFGRHCTR